MEQDIQHKPDAAWEFKLFADACPDFTEQYRGKEGGMEYYVRGACRQGSGWVRIPGAQ
jgi:hypothetical protein